MTRKTVKDLEKEVTNLREQFQDLKNNFDTLSVKYSGLEKEHNQCVTNSKLIFKCNTCDQQFEKQEDLKEHKRKEHASFGQFSCDLCDMLFTEEWKLRAHVKGHTNYSCDLCDKKFKLKDTLKKHITAAHEHLKLYCHHFNNNKVCIHKTGCVFIHEDSEACKYGEKCERKNCMYKHEPVEDAIEDENNDEPYNDERSDSNDNDNNEIKEADKSDVENVSGDEKEEYEKDENIENDDAKEEHVHNSTFMNPSQVESEIIEFDVLVPCKDHWLRNDQSLYFQRLVSIPEVEKVENLWITPTKDYQVGSLLPTKVTFKTKFGNKFKNDKVFRQNVWKKLEFVETSPEQE